MAVTGGRFVKWKPGSIVTFTTAAAVTQGRLVEITGAMTVGMAAAGSRKVVGVALQTSDAAGDKIAVQLLGYIIKCRASGAVAAGDEVMAAANGDVQAVAAAGAAYVQAEANNARAIVGVAVEAIANGLEGNVLVGRA